MEKRRKKMEEKVIKKRLFHCSWAGREREKRKVRFSFDSELWFWWNEGWVSFWGAWSNVLVRSYFKNWVKFSGLAEAGLWGGLDGEEGLGWWGKGWGLQEAKGGGGESVGDGGGHKAKLRSPRMCLIWGAVETLGWAASAKSKQNGWRERRGMFHASSSLRDCILLAKRIF